MIYYYIEIVKPVEDMKQEIAELLGQEITNIVYHNRKIVEIEYGEFSEEQLLLIEQYMNAWGYTRALIDDLS